MRRLLVVALSLSAAARALAAQQGTPFLVAPAVQGVVLRWVWPETERPLGYHVERRAAGGAWTRVTPRPIARVRNRAEARTRLGDAYDRYQPLLFPDDPLAELRDPETYRSLLLLMADVEPEVARLLGLRFDDRDAPVGNALEYRLIALTRAGEAQVAASPAVVAGAYRAAVPPDSLEIRQVADGVGLRWGTSGAFSAYHVYRRRGAAGQWVEISATPVIVFSDDAGAATEASPRFYRDSTAAVGDTLWYAVAGIDPFGRASGRSAAVRLVVRDVIPPAPPQQVTAGVRGDTVVLSWVPSPDPQTVAYRVWRAADRDGTFEPLAGPLPASARRGVDPGRPAGRIWWYYVTAVDGAGNESPPSFTALAEVPDVAPPQAPDSLRGTGSVGAIALAWAPVTAPDLRGYRVYRASLQHGEFALLNDRPFPGPLFTDSVPGAADHAFYYRVTAVDSAFNESRPSATVAVRPPDSTPPSAPQILSVAPGEGALVVTWSANPEPDVTWYRLRTRLRGRASWREQPDSTAASVQSSRIADLGPGDLVEVSLVAIDDAGNRSPPARPVVGRAFKRQAPRAVELRRAVYDRDRQGVILEWAAPSAEIARLVVLRRAERDSAWAEVGLVVPGARRFEDRQVRAGARLEYALVALDRFGNRAQSRVRRISVADGRP